MRALGYDPQELQLPGGDETVLATGDIFVTDPAVRAGLEDRAELVDRSARALGAWLSGNCVTSGP